MQDEGSSVWQQLQDLAADGVRLQARLARGYAAAVVAASRREGPSRRRVLEVVGSEGAAYLRELGRLNLRYARAWQDVVTHSSERLKDGLSGDESHPRRAAGSGGTSYGHAGGSAGPAAPPRVVMSLEGEVGASASGTFAVANSFDEVVDLSFAAGRFVDSGDAHGGSFSAPVTFEPESLPLAPGEESTVTLTLQLPEPLFEAGRTYRGEVRVVGGNGAVLDVSVRPRQARKLAAPTNAATELATNTAAAKTAAKQAGGKKAGGKKATATKATATKATATKATATKASPTKAAATRPARARRTPPRQG